jgi:hypothetical protein
MATEAHGIVTNWSSSINTVFTAETHDCMENVRPGPVEKPAWAVHDYKDVGGRVTHGAVTEELEHQK